MSNKIYIKEIRKKIINITSVKPSKVSELSQQLNININTLRGKAGAKVWKFSGSAIVSGEIAAEVEFTAMMELPLED